MDIAEIGEGWKAIEAAQNGNIDILIERIRSNKPLMDFEREFIADRLAGKRGGQAKRGPKSNETTRAKNSELWRTFWWLRYVDNWEKEDAIHEEMARRSGAKSADSIRKRLDKIRSSKRSGMQKIMDGHFIEGVRLYRLGIYGLSNIEPLKPEMLKEEISRQAAQNVSSKMTGTN